MPLTLVTGPANAAKAGFVLSAFREALDRAGGGRLAAPEPLLVVPTSGDVEPYQRELAGAGAVFGGEVVTFNGLVRQIAAATGFDQRPLGPVARERVVASVARDARLVALGASAGTPGFATAAGRFFAELQRSLVSPGRLRSALRAWGGGGAAGEEAADLYSAYRSRLERLGRVDDEGWMWGALDRLRATPARWAGRPVFLYGFDDLSPAQVDAVETLSRAADVVVSLPYEAGRAAFAGRAAAVEELRPVAARVEALPDRSEHYARRSRAALHHLERRLFEDADARVEPGEAVRLLEAGGERAEAELVGAAVLDLLAEGVEPSGVAVLVRTPEEAPLLEQVLTSYGIPTERKATVPVASTRLGAGLLAFARAALPGGAAADLLTWLRTPGKSEPEAVDELEARVRRRELSTAADARRHWPGGPLRELDALATAARDPTALLEVLEAELEAMWTAPWRRAGTVLGSDGEADAQVAAAVRGACAELRGLADADPALLGGAEGVLESLGAVRVGLRAGRPDGVLLADPLAVRARRFRAVFVCGLQDGAFPRRALPDPFLDDDDRRALAAASGLVLPLHEDVLARERYLFYAAVSRAEERLYLSFRSSDEEGEPQIPSPFVADVRSLFAPELWERRGRRLLAEITWEPAQAPTDLELRRAIAARSPAIEPSPLPPPRGEQALAVLAARECEPARGLETFAACGVRWLVESLLRPRRLEPDPEPMRRGALAHRVLERTLTRLRERTGSARLWPGSHDAAGEALSDAVAELGERRPGARAQAAVRALEVDLRRWLDAECAADTGLEPRLLEWSFGTGEEPTGPPALEIAPGVRVSGRVDRVDVGPDGVAVVRDYKNSDAPPAARWVDEGRLQAGLYALAVRDVLGLSPAGAVYQPLSGRDLRPRGAVAAGVIESEAFVGNDVLEPEEFDALLEALRRLAVQTAGDLRAGRVRPCPERCTPRGCAYPGICRGGER